MVEVGPAATNQHKWYYLSIEGFCFFFFFFFLFFERGGGGLSHYEVPVLGHQLKRIRRVVEIALHTGSLGLVDEKRKEYLGP